MSLPSDALGTTDDTIVAIASARGSAARGIIRVSGPVGVAAVATLVPSATAQVLAAATQSCVEQAPIWVPRVGSVPAYLYVWPNCSTYTRQPTVEIHTVGSVVVLDAMVEALCGAGCRLARPGEFTLRAFLAGRLDLAQAEAVLGVIDARDARQLNQALQVLSGGVSQPLQMIRSDLLDLCADLEAGLDFVDEGISFLTKQELLSRVEQARNVIGHALQQMRTRDVLVDVPVVVLLGRPNVGKSSLMNALGQSNVSIVTSEAGTTRDFISQRLEYRGQTFDLVDTAGIHRDDDCDSCESDTLVGAAQQMTHRSIERATLSLLCLDAARPTDDWERAQWEKVQHNLAWIVVATKCDSRPPKGPTIPGMATSSVTRAGIPELLDEIADRLADRQDNNSGGGSISSRCAVALQLAMDATTNACDLVNVQNHAEELIAAELRLALNFLADVVGAVYTDDLLDRIFSRFCIGK